MKDTEQKLNSATPAPAEVVESTVLLSKIVTEADYNKAMESHKAMMIKGEDPYLLTLIIEDYERESVKIDGCDPVEMIRYTQDRLNLLDIEMAKKLGMPKGRFSEVMNYKRPLTISQIRNCVSLGMPANVMIKVCGQNSSKIREKVARLKAEAARLESMILG